jgi:hypothetical protein
MTDQEKIALYEREREETRQSGIVYLFLQNHLKDYLPCAANTQILNDYMRKNGMEMFGSLDNLERAFQAVKHQLAQPPNLEAQAVPQVQATAATEKTPEQLLDEEFPLPAKWFHPYSVEDIQRLDREDFRRMFHAPPPFGEAFRKRLERIYATRGIHTDQRGGWRR